MTEQEKFALLESAKDNTVIFDALEKAMVVLDDRTRKVCASISGGADSDLVVDMVSKIRDDAHYVWFNTGMEYQATKRHLDYLENRYGIKIERYRAVVPVPLGVKRYGFPFISKNFSGFIDRLQKHGFKFEDKPYEELLAEYPNCKSSLRWWCNEWGENSTFNISRWKYLKEFLIENPPKIKISEKCCEGAKKKVSKRYNKENGIDLTITGERKFEGGSRIGTTSCFTGTYEDNTAKFRPIFWFKDADKAEYEAQNDIRHSECYWHYGLDRTGCVGCPFGRNWRQELEVAKQYEPKLYKLCVNVFKPSYDYTLQYYKFREEKEAERIGYRQLSLFD